MAEPPIIKIQKDYVSPPNVEADVPGSQTIRELDAKSQDDAAMDTSEIQMTGAEFTLSPVITVTQKETSLTKGAMKSQKVTVTQDIAAGDTENGGDRVSREDDSLMQTDREQDSNTVVNSERRVKRVKEGNMDDEDKSHDEKKSKIPIMRLKQAVEKVKHERQAQKAREKPRRSSIPKLKDAKKSVKRDGSLKFEPKLEDEFEKIYEEIVDNKQKEIDDKILAVQIEDTEKVESKFEEIIQSYDEDEHEKQTVTRISKIPALRRRDDDRPSRIGALIDRAKDKNTVTESKLKDGGFNVTASTIRTKRFSRGNSRDLSTEDLKVDITDPIDIKESGDNDVFVRENAKKAPVKPERSIRSISKRINKDGHKVVETIENTSGGSSQKIVKETIVKEGVPLKTKKITRIVSREMRDNENIDTNRNLGDIKNNEETVTVEESRDEGSHIITTRTTIKENIQVTPVTTEKIVRSTSHQMSTESQNVNLIENRAAKEGGSKNIPVKPERFTRGISREMGNIKQKDNTETVEEIKDDGRQKVIKKTITRENVKVGIPVKKVTKETLVKQTNNEDASSKIDDSKGEIKKETMTTEKIVKESIKVGIPVFTKVTQSFSKGKIQNVEMSRTIEWKPADEIRTKHYSRSVSEKVTKKELQNIGNGKFEAPTAISEATDDLPKVQTDNENDITTTQVNTPKDPVLEREIKETVKDIASKITIKKVTEYQSEEQVTNVEKNTYSLSKTVDLTVGIDSKEPTQIDEQISSIDSKEIGQIDIEQVSNEYSTETNKESILTDTVTEKRETVYSNLPTQEKDSDNEEVTILKGNVSRLKNKISKENVVVSKKETDAELPEKKSILSKIALFERLEPREPPPIIKSTIPKCKYVANKKPKIVNELLKEQPNMDSFGDTNKVEIGLNYDEVTYVNEPVIVKEFWKTEEGGGQNVSTINQVITEKTMTLQTQEDTTKDGKNVQQIDLHTGEILKGRIDFAPVESRIEFAQTLPAQTQFKSNEHQFEVATSLPGQIDFDPYPPTTDEVAEIKDDKSKIPTDDKQFEYEAEIGKTKPGKININIWKNQVEVNKTLVDKIEVLRGESLEEIAKTLPGKVDFKTYESQAPVSKALPERFDLKEDQLQFTKQLPAKIDFEIKEIQFEVADILPGSIKYETDDSLNQVGMILPDDIDFKTLDNKFDFVNDLPTIDLKTDEIQTEIAKPLPGKIDIDIEQPEILPNKENYLKPDKSYIKSSEKEFNKPTPGKINLNIWKNQVEVNKTLVGKAGVKKSKAGEIGKPLPGKFDFKTYDKQVEVTKTMQGKIDFKKSENKVGIGKTFPGQTDLSNTGSQVETANTLPGEVKTSITESQVEEIMLFPGTIDFSNTESQVVVVETPSDTVEFSTTDPEVEATTTLPGKNDFDNNVNEDEIHRALPGKIEFETYEYNAKVSETLQDNVYYSTTDENQTQDISIKADENRVEIAKPLPGKLDLKAWQNQVKVSKTLVDKINVVRSENLDEIAKTFPGKIDFMTYESQVEQPKILPGIIDINTFESKVQITETSQKNIDLESTEDEANVATILPSKVDFESFDNKPQLNHFHIGLNENNGLSNEIDQGKTDPNKIEIPSASDPRESLSDPELVDEDPEVNVQLKNDSIIGKIKRKMYFITNKDKVQNSTNNTIETEISVVSESKGNDYEKKVDELLKKSYSIHDIGRKTPTTIEESVTTVTTVSNTATENLYKNTVEHSEENHKHHAKQYELNNNLNTAHNNVTTSRIEVNTTKQYLYKDDLTETNENGFDFTPNKAQNELTRSAYDADDLKTTREDLKRAKSLAELDLGDVINGTVQRMVGRMKSVDFGRRENIKTEKISIKEMPKKLSVLEKIALFEGKASPSRNESTTFSTRITKKNDTQVISEEEYLHKIEELTNAKTKFGRLEEMLYLPLSNGFEMPVIAVGTALMDNRLLPYLIGAAIDLGYRAIDTAYIYGNEKEIGQAIKAKIDDGTVKREDLFIISKLWSTYHRPDLVEEACKASLKNLGLEYFDLYMIHNPMSFKEGPEPIPKIATVLQYSQYDYLDAWFGMEGLVSKGLVRSIGVSNFNSQQIQRILDKGRIRPVVNQVECHPYLSQQRLHGFCAERNITLSCFGVLGSKGTPAEFKSSVTPAIDDALVQVMASGLSVSPAQLLIRYQIECGHNVVVKSSTAARLWDNLQALTFTLEQPQVDALHALNRNKRIFDFRGMGDTHKNYPFRAGY